MAHLAIRWCSAFFRNTANPVDEVARVNRYFFYGKIYTNIYS